MFQNLRETMNFHLENNRLDPDLLIMKKRNSTVRRVLVSMLLTHILCLAPQMFCTLTDLYSGLNEGSGFHKLAPHSTLHMFWEGVNICAYT